MDTINQKVYGNVGPARYTDNEDQPIRLMNDGSLVIGEAHGKYALQTIRGNSYVWSAAAGAALTTPATSTAPMLWNPMGNGRICVLTKVVLGYTAVGTPAIGFVEYAYSLNMGSQIGTAAPVVSLTQVAGVNLALGAQGAGAVTPDNSGMRFAPATVSLAAAPTFLCPASLSEPTGMTGTPFKMEDDLDGRIQIWPGAAFFVCASAAISSSFQIALYGYMIPIPLTV